jgi:hypothetical protein
MKHSKNNFTSLLAPTLVLIGVVGRLVPHIPNVTPIGGLSVWSGSRVTFKQSVAIVLGTMIVTDLFLGFHPTLPYVYASLLVTLALTHWIKPKNFWSIGGTTLAHSALFFVITNFGVWQMAGLYETPLYPHTWQGLIQSYINALPFLRYSVLGDVAYVAIFFGLEYMAGQMVANSGKLQFRTHIKEDL